MCVWGGWVGGGLKLYLRRTVITRIILCQDGQPCKALQFVLACGERTTFSLGVKRPLTYLLSAIVINLEEMINP